MSSKILAVRANEGIEVSVDAVVGEVSLLEAAENIVLAV
jgi:hypothetical protein